MSTDFSTIPDQPDTAATMRDVRRKVVTERVGAVTISDVGTRAQHWLWPGRIPLGDVTLLAGDPGVGKSLLALDLAARVSRGAPWPDAERQGDKEWGRQGETGADSSLSRSPCLPVSQSSSPPGSCPSALDSRLSTPGSVILFSAEDSLSGTIRPRLEEAGADCSRIVAIQMSVTMKDAFALFEQDTPKNFELRRDLRELWSLIHVTPDCRLVVIDSINSCLSENSENIRVDDWGMLLRLVAIARRTRVAVVVVTHLRKKGGRAIYCNLGSLAFAAAARAVWAVTKDPESADRRLFVPIKNNLASDASGLAFKIESGPAGRVAKITWSPEPVSALADTVVSYSRSNGRPNDERQQAKVWLQERLASGPRAVNELREEADVNGFSRNTLSRAFRELKGRAVKEATADGPWFWQLPVEETQNPRGEFWAPSKNAEEIA